jgi:hypothetical protein
MMPTEVWYSSSSGPKTRPILLHQMKGREVLRDGTYRFKSFCGKTVRDKIPLRIVRLDRVEFCGRCFPMKATIQAHYRAEAEKVAG